MTSPPAARRPAERRVYVDWARGFAVLLMIEAHVVDAWTHPSERGSVAFGIAVMFGGFAAPLFLWLAGLAVALAAARTSARTGDRAARDAACRRGLEIFLLAFLFRLQAFIVSPPSTPLKLFRVDILNIMGPAIVATGLVWAAAKSTTSRVALFAAAATIMAMATPIVRISPLVDRLPLWFQWYTRPAGEFTTFTLFPWAGFVFAGAAAGVLLAQAGSNPAERRLHIALGAAGALLIAGGLLAAAQPSIYRSSSFWTSSPTWFAVRVGILMLGLTACYMVGISQFRAFGLSWQGPLARMGRSSLFIYWIHVELVYGYASWLWRGRLPLWGTAAGYIAFCALMYGAVILRDWVVANWRRIGAVRTLATR